MMPRDLANSRVTVIAVSDPTKAASGRTMLAPKINTNTAPNEAPDDNPSKNGSANELRVSACMTAPDTARPAPTAAAVKARGSRICQTIPSSMRVRPDSPNPAWWAKLAHTSPILRCAGPIVTATVMDASKTTINAALHSTVFDHVARLPARAIRCETTVIVAAPDERQRLVPPECVEPCTDSRNRSFLNGWGSEERHV